MASTQTYIIAAIVVIVLVAAHRHNQWMAKNCVCKDDAPMAAPMATAPVTTPIAADAPLPPTPSTSGTKGGFATGTNATLSQRKTLNPFASWMPRWITTV